MSTLRLPSSRFASLLSLLAFPAMVACADDAAPKGEAATLTATGKADGDAWLTPMASVGLGSDAAVEGRFDGRDAFFGHALDVRAGATVDLEITRSGSAASLDSVMYVFGPVAADGTFADRAVAMDDDSGDRRLSRLKSLTLESGGRYLVVVTTYDGRGKGRYRLQATCLSGECGPLAPEPAAGVCHPKIEAAIRACFEGWMQDSDRDPYTMPSDEVMRQCADAEIVAPAWDELCLVDAPDVAVCGRDLEDFSYNQLAACRHALVGQTYDQQCIFGARYHDIFTRTAPLVVQWKLRLTIADIDSLDALERRQLVAAVRETAYDEVQTAEDAFGAVDAGEVNQSWVWDASGRRQFVVYEVGAGDNSFGAVFPVDAENVVARIIDGDFHDCNVGWGPERRWCSNEEPCADGLVCNGAGEYGGGLCLDSSRDDIAGRDASCDSDLDCGAGLVCAGASFGGGGICNPAWMRGYYGTEPDMPIPDGPSGTTSFSLNVAGLATVSTDVRVDLFVTHPRVSDLRIELVNPLGTRGVVFDGSRGGTELYLRGVPVLGFPGDESVNGEWTLELTDRVSGQVGRLHEFGLTLTSRWD